MARSNVRFRMYIAKYKKTIAREDGTFKEIWCEVGKAFRDEGPAAMSNIHLHLHSLPVDPNWNGQIVLYPLEEKN